MKKSIKNTIITFYYKCPLYPHWLEFYKMERANQIVLKGLHGNVLEVGAGDGSRKVLLLKQHNNILKYCSTDYTSWNDEFIKIDLSKKKKGFLGILNLFKGTRERNALDEICSATNLPFKDESFHYHLSFEVLEHISDPQKFFSEAARVLKKGGNVVLSVPFLYRMHGGEPDHKLDYFRPLNGFFYDLEKTSGLRVVSIYSNTGFGTSVASITNQFVISRIIKSNLIVKVLLLILAPSIFILTNIIGYFIDIFPDVRFSTRFHVVLSKI
jgi:SAM-dependent methyltransferase